MLVATVRYPEGQLQRNELRHYELSDVAILHRLTQDISDAVSVALSTWLGAVAAAVTLLVVVRARLDRRRHAAWERELDDLAADGGSRSDRW